MAEPEKVVEMTPPTPGQGDAKPETPASDSPDVLKAELDKVRAALKDANKEAAERRKKLEAFEEAEAKRKQAEMTEAQKLQAQLEEKTKKLAELERAALQRQAAQKAGLPDVFAGRLQGSTPEEMEADAKALVEALPKPKPQINPTNPGAGATQGETIEQQRARIYGSGGNPFDPNLAPKNGGGVFWKPSDET
jgi:hypothetical protein